MQLRWGHLVKTAAGPASFSTSIQDFTERLEGGKTLDATWQLVSEGFAAQGIDYLVYMFLRPTALDDNALVRSNFPQWYTDYYYQERRGRDDPFLELCHTFTPMLTGREFVDDYADRLPREHQLFIREAGETGAISGISSPVRLMNPGHFGGWNFLTNMRRAEFEAYISVHCERLQLMGFIAHEALQKAAHSRTTNGTAGNLSERERECLFWLARGLRTAEIAERLSLAPVTVEFHFRRIRTKLAASTREEALAKSILSGEIVP